MSVAVASSAGFPPLLPELCGLDREPCCGAVTNLISTPEMNPVQAPRRVGPFGTGRDWFPWLLGFWVLFSGVWAWPQSRQAGAVSVSPDEFRAAFLSKIPMFVTWPETVLGPDDEALVIGLLGGGTFVPLLEALLKEVRVGSRPVRVQSVDKVEELPRCQILFIPEARSDEVARIPSERRGGLLTVGEEPGFTKKGGVFNLSLADRKLTVNVRNARAAGLELQSRLLRIAEVER